MNTVVFVIELTPVIVCLASVEQKSRPVCVWSCVSVCMYGCLSVCLSVCMYGCLYVCMYVIVCRISWTEITSCITGNIYLLSALDVSVFLSLRCVNGQSCTSHILLTSTAYITATAPSLPPSPSSVSSSSPSPLPSPFFTQCWIFVVNHVVLHFNILRLRF